MRIAIARTVCDAKAATRRKRRCRCSPWRDGTVRLDRSDRSGPIVTRFPPSSADVLKRPCGVTPQNQRNVRIPAWPAQPARHINVHLLRCLGEPMRCATAEVLAPRLLLARYRTAMTIFAIRKPEPPRIELRPCAGALHLGVQDVNGAYRKLATVISTHYAAGAARLIQDC